MESIISYFIEDIKPDAFQDCTLPYKNGHSCHDCFNKGIYEDGWAEYMCENKNALYISKLLPACYEENIELLLQLDNTSLDCSNLRVMTIGQGPGAEVLALKNYLYTHKKLPSPNTTLVTIDKTPAWLCEYDLIVEGINYDRPFYWDESDPHYFETGSINIAHHEKLAVDPIKELNEDLRGMFPVLDYGFDLTFIGHFFSNLSASDTAKFAVNLKDYVHQRYILLRSRNNQQFYNNLEMFLKIVGGRVIYHSDSKDPLEHEFTPYQEQQVKPDLFKSSVRMLILCDQPS